jgi:methyl-accepting chemotaxis protein
LSGTISQELLQLSSASAKQRQEVDAITDAIQSMNSTIADSNNRMKLANGAAESATADAERSKTAMKEMLTGMTTIATVVDEAARTIESLGSSSEEIGAIIQVIEEIADQTNLLALNAAIEAARAGEQGRGFAVVADEVRKLAERTQTATKQIAQTITRIQKETATVVDVMHHGTNKVKNGQSIAENAEQLSHRIIGRVNEMSGIIQGLGEISQNQLLVSEQIASRSEIVRSVAVEAEESVRSSVQSAQSLDTTTHSLKELVDTFHTEHHVQRSTSYRNNLASSSSHTPHHHRQLSTSGMQTSKKLIA